MQFFGYLRENPDDPQDTDYTGYDFRLTKLNTFNGNYVNAEMVKAFISQANIDAPDRDFRESHKKKTQKAQRANPFGALYAFVVNIYPR